VPTRGPSRGAAVATLPATAKQSTTMVVQEKRTLAQPGTLASTPRLLGATTPRMAPGTLQSAESAKTLMLPPAPPSASWEATTGSFHAPITVAPTVLRPTTTAPTTVQAAGDGHSSARGSAAAPPGSSAWGSAAAPPGSAAAPPGSSAWGSAAAPPGGSSWGSAAAPPGSARIAYAAGQVGMSALLSKQLTVLPPAPFGSLGPSNRRPTDDEAHVVNVPLAPGQTMSFGSTNGPHEHVNISVESPVDARLRTSSSLLYDTVQNGVAQPGSNQASSPSVERSSAAAFIRGASPRRSDDGPTPVLQEALLRPGTSSEEVQALNAAYLQLLAQTRQSQKPDPPGVSPMPENHVVKSTTGSNLSHSLFSSPTKSAPNSSPPRRQTPQKTSTVTLEQRPSSATQDGPSRSRAVTEPSGPREAPDSRGLSYERPWRTNSRSSTRERSGPPRGSAGAAARGSGFPKRPPSKTV